ncbi:MAG: thioredoxin family protein [Gemmatimonadota bacterium]|nr:thioredoxin family protein [Gemmatimonadota bacterium]
MLSTAILALSLAASPVRCTQAPQGSVTPRIPVASDSLPILYSHGKTWGEFLEAAKSRRQTWLDNYENGVPAADQVARASAIPGRWRFLVVAEDWCGDSANTIPYLVRLVEQVPTLELRIINSSVGGGVMQSHQTEDGRGATPTVVVLDEAGQERGCWVERPYALRKVVADLKAGITTGNQVEVITAWRAEDRGRSTVADIVDLVELVAAGTARCP